MRPSFGAALEAVTAVTAVAAAVAAINGAALDAAKVGVGGCGALVVKRRAIVAGV